MAFFETRFPDDIAYGATGGPGFQTDVIAFDSGHEQRNAAWQDARCSWDVAHGAKKPAQIAALLAFFRLMQGRTHGFRFKDWNDFTVAAGEGVFSAISATQFRLVKRYTTAGNNHDRIISKPVSGTVVVTGGTVSSIDHTTGIVTMTSGTPTSWTGQFDVPVRFDIDQMKTSVIAYNTYTWGQIPVVEIRP